MVEPLFIGDRQVGPGHACFVIAEAGVNHNGSIKRALKMVKIASDSGADAVAIASMLHYAALNRDGSLVANYDEEGNTEFLKKNGSFKMFGKENISEIKVQLNKYDIPLRILN